MTVRELIAEIDDHMLVGANTCDTVKAGSVNKELHRVAVTMFATVETVKKVLEWGADFLIVHEPTYYEHMETLIPNDPVIAAKKKLIDESGLAIYRFHDHIHLQKPDGIDRGVADALGFDEPFEDTGFFGSYRLTAKTPVTGAELARRAEEKLGLHHVRIAGERNHPSTHIVFACGTPQGVYELLRDKETEIVITGEICEWMLAEYARDASALGIPKTIIVPGHIGSERDGMKALARRLSDKHKNFETRYFECGEVYTYADMEA